MRCVSLAMRQAKLKRQKSFEEKVKHYLALTAFVIMYVFFIYVMVDALFPNTPLGQ